MDGYRRNAACSRSTSPMMQRDPKQDDNCITDRRGWSVEHRRKPPMRSFGHLQWAWARAYGGVSSIGGQKAERVTQARWWGT